MAVTATGLLLVLARTFVVDSVVVSSGSMRPTVCAGDWLLVLSAGAAAGARVGDVVVFDSPVDEEPGLKRVVAVGGQRVEVRDAVLHVDGAPVQEAYVDARTVDGTFFGPAVVPEGSVFVMGDDRERSVDSRSYGPVPRADVDGVVLARVRSACA